MDLPEDWWLELDWTESGDLEPLLVALYADQPVEDDDVRVTLDRAQAYAWLDACVDAEAQDKEHPDPLNVLLPEQRRALLALHEHGEAIVAEATRQSAALWRAKGQSSRPEHLTLMSAQVTDRCADGLAYVLLQFSSVLHVEHGLQALLLGDQVQRVAHEIPEHNLPGTPPAPVPARKAETLPDYMRISGGAPEMGGLLDDLLAMGLRPKATAAAADDSPRASDDDPLKALLRAMAGTMPPPAKRPPAPEPIGESIHDPEPVGEPEPAGLLPEGLLTIWEEREWIELTPDADRAKVRAALEALVEELPASKVADAVCELEGVEELYASDDELEEFLELW